MYVSVSVTGPAPRTRGAPSKPAAARWPSSACVAARQGAVGRTTVSPTRTTRPRLAVPPGSGTSVRVGASAVSKPEQAAGEFCVRDEAMDKPSSNRGKDSGTLVGVIGDAEDERDPGEQRSGRDDHPAVKRGRDRAAVGADEHPGQLRADPEGGERLSFKWRDGVVDRGQPRSPGADGDHRDRHARDEPERL